MKKFFCLLLTLCVVFCLSACANDSANEGGGTLPPDYDSAESNILIAYFTWADNTTPPDTDAVASPSVVVPGNTALVAQYIQEVVGGELFSIRVTDLYPNTWDECLDRANEERREDARPALSESVENFSEYDVIFLGYPNWWYGCPMALLSFLESYDFDGKTVVPFCTHGTGGLANSLSQIEEAIPNANMLQVFHVGEDDAADSQADVLTWLADLGFILE